MKKTGYQNIRDMNTIKKRPTCVSCGGIATKRVVFENDWCTLKVALCASCALLEYEELNLQRSLRFPGVA
jgi:hypothetical protein